jgi:hypothetical protein
MDRQMKWSLLLGGVLVMQAAPVVADSHMQDRDRDRMHEKMEDRMHDNDWDKERDRSEERERVYGWELMSEDERKEHWRKMRHFRTEQEREEYRRQHHKLMQQRAKKMGIDLEDVPMERGRMMR